MISQYDRVKLICCFNETCFFLIFMSHRFDSHQISFLHRHNGRRHKLAFYDDEHQSTTFPIELQEQTRKIFKKKRFFTIVISSSFSNALNFETKIKYWNWWNHDDRIDSSEASISFDLDSISKFKRTEQVQWDERKNSLITIQFTLMNRLALEDRRSIESNESYKTRKIYISPKKRNFHLKIADSLWGRLHRMITTEEIHFPVN